MLSSIKQLHAERSPRRESYRPFKQSSSSRLQCIRRANGFSVVKNRVNSASSFCHRKSTFHGRARAHKLKRRLNLQRWKLLAGLQSDRTECNRRKSRLSLTKIPCQLTADVIPRVEQRSSSNSRACSTLPEPRVCKGEHFRDRFQTAEQRQPVAL